MDFLVLKHIRSKKFIYKIINNNNGSFIVVQEL